MLSKWLAALFLAVCSTHAMAADRIERMEPVSWWVGMQDPRLQLMVHGARIAELEPTLDHPGVQLTGVHRVANPNYLFVDLEIAPETRPGPVRIDFRKGGRSVARHDYLLQAREPGSAQRRGFGPQDVIYLLMPDRFANGNPANDTVAGLQDGLARSKPLGRHGGDLQGVANHLDYIAGMGFTQLWLNPVLENAQPDASYHGYAITDFYRVDPRLGSNEDFRAAGARRPRAQGIGVIMDVVLNHIGSSHWWMRDLPAPDWINYGGKFTATHHARESLQDPHGAEADRRGFTDGWFVETMPDLNQRNPFLATYLIQNTLWWIEYAGPVRPARGHLSVLRPRVPHRVVAPRDAGVPEPQRGRRGMERQPGDRVVLAARPQAGGRLRVAPAGPVRLPAAGGRVAGPAARRKAGAPACGASTACWPPTACTPTRTTSWCSPTTTTSAACTRCSASART